ncbi:MAG TPA: hypothetical protein VFP69_17290 [Streptomyces sp.]|nr:hypothetical protein [Streptomyces sp.]
MTELAHTEYLYELWDANWDDGPLGNYQIRRHKITKKTPKRIYFTYGNGRTGYVDRQKIEADGEIYPATRCAACTCPRRRSPTRRNGPPWRS